ncbi:MAG: hypothetical protein ACRDJ9_13550, partial [Dehalococcoidia bacterium]
RLLRVFFESYGMEIDAPDAFVRRAMSYTLLHEFDDLGTLLRAFPALHKIDDLEEMAVVLWDPRAPGFTL